MKTGALGKVYQNGETIIQQGEKGDCLYIIQEGMVEVFSKANGQEIHLAKLGEGDFFGEMAVFEQSVRSTSVRALGAARVLTVDKKNFLRRMEEDPSLAFRFLEIMSTRIRGMDHQLSQMHKPETWINGDYNRDEGHRPGFRKDRRVMACLVSNPGGLV